MKLINSPYKIECSKCKQMKNLFIFKNKALICLDCANTKYKSIQSKTKLTETQLNSIRKNLMLFEKNRPKIKIIYGGCCN